MLNVFTEFSTSPQDPAAYAILGSPALSQRFEDGNRSGSFYSSANASVSPQRATGRNMDRDAPQWSQERLLHAFYSERPILSGAEKRTWLIAEMADSSTSAPMSGWLDDALNELAVCPDIAVDEGLEKPSPAAIEKTEVLLKEVSRYVEDQPDLYPMDEGSIAVEFRNPDIRSGVLFLIEKNGSGAYFSRTRKSRCRGRVEDAADLLSEGGLAEIRKVEIR